VKKNLFLFLAFCGLFVMPMKASDDPKTLPPAMYEQLKSGKKLDKVWVDPSYDKAKGFKVAPLAYKAELRVGDVMDSLNKVLGTLATADSGFTLKVAVVKVSTKTFTGFGNIMGAVTVEGQVLDTDGKVVAAFITKEKAGGFGGGKDDYATACDRIASDIAKDLL
jgi:hypothetical protein